MKVARSYGQYVIALFDSKQSVVTFSDPFSFPVDPKSLVVRNSIVRSEVGLQKLQESQSALQKSQQKSQLFLWINDLNLTQDYSSLILEKLDIQEIKKNGKSKEYWEAVGIKPLGDRIKLSKAVPLLK